jgi:hypothetical protein
LPDVSCANATSDNKVAQNSTVKAFFKVLMSDIDFM